MINKEAGDMNYWIGKLFSGNLILNNTNKIFINIHAKQFIHFTFTSFIIQGLTDNDNEGTFTWLSDGTEFDYSNWSKGEPNNAFWNEDCAHLRKVKSFEWNDSNCDGRNGNTALCQKF